MYLDGKKFAALFDNPQLNHDAICVSIQSIANNVVNNFKQRAVTADDLEDMASCATLKCIRNIDKFDSSQTDNAFSYFTTVAVHAMHEWHGKEKRQKRFVGNEPADSSHSISTSTLAYSGLCEDEPILPMTVYQVCERLGIGESTLNLWRELGYIDAVPGWRQDRFRFMYDEFNVARLERTLTESRQRHGRYHIGLELSAAKLNTIERAAERIGLEAYAMYEWIKKGVILPVIEDGQAFIHDDDLPVLATLVAQAKGRAAHALIGMRLIMNDSLLPGEAAMALKIHGQTLNRWAQHGLIRRRDDGMYDRCEVERVNELLLQYEAQQYIGRCPKYFRKHLKLGNLKYVCSIGHRKWYSKDDLDVFVAMHGKSEVVNTL